MLVKVLKSHNVLSFTPFKMPEIGAAANSNGVANFEFPALAPVIAPAFENPILHDAPEQIELDTDFLQNAQAEAEQIIAQAEAQAAAIEQAATEKGLHAARQTVASEVAAQVADLRGQLSNTINEVNDLRAAILSQAENELVRLALEIAKKIVQREVTIDREIALTLARVTLAKLHTRAHASVHLNPEDFAFVNAHREKLDFHGSLELVEDRSISAGGCLVRAETGDIDARIEQQFDEISRGLLAGN